MERVGQHDLICAGKTSYKSWGVFEKLPHALKIWDWKVTAHMETKWGFGKQHGEFQKFVFYSVSTYLKYSLHKHALLRVSSGVYVEAAMFLFSKISLFTVRCETAWELQLHHLEQAWDHTAHRIVY